MLLARWRAANSLLRASLSPLVANGFIGTRVASARRELRTSSFLLRLRKLFESDPANPRHFLTIRDMGYRFVARPEAAENQ